MSATPKSLNNMEAFWMPFTSNRQFKRNPRLFVGAKDMHYTTDDGRQVLDGTAADTDYVKGLQFTVLLTCQVETTDEEGSPILGTVFSGEVTIAGGETVSIVDADGKHVLLPFGTHCFGEETDTNGASSAVIDADSFENAEVVTADDEEQLLTITATNTFNIARITVAKVVEGNGAAGPYTFELTCTTADGDEFPLAAADAAFTLSHGQSRTIEVLEGVECIVVETNVPAGALVSIVDTDDSTPGGTVDGIVIGGSVEQKVTVTNKFTPLASTGFGGDMKPLVFGGIGVLLIGVLALFLVARRRRSPADSES